MCRKTAGTVPISAFPDLVATVVDVDCGLMMCFLAAFALCEHASSSTVL
jgi:hypothetical protein